MTALQTTRIGLPTGVTLTVQLGGPEDGPPVLLLHGFPESHRTWRKIAPELAARGLRVAAPDQRGFAGSDKPEGVAQYETARIIEDAIALADALGFREFTLVGHDWGGAVAWGAALKHPDRVRRLVIVNAPHPYVFQKSLIEDAPQRLASQYIRAFRSPLMEAGIAAMGLSTFFDKTFGSHVDLAIVPPEEKQAYLDQWGRPGALTAMLNWYRAAQVEVPAPDEEAAKPLWLHLPFPKVIVPTLVVWGMKDSALLPVQLEALGDHVADLRIERVADAGHFLPWERPQALLDALDAFLADP
jgi:pimeloyl-ACP methyl ester carboxylesterase